MSHEIFFSMLRSWQGFYSLIGSAAATLTGLMFIAASLGARLLDENAGPKVRTFITPAVIYFSLAILISALMNIPTQTRLSLMVELAMLGLVGSGYTISHLPRLRRFSVDGSLGRQTWIWNLFLPLFSSLWLLAGAVLLRNDPGAGLTVAAVGALLLVMIGLHNAWSVTLRMVSMTPSDV